MKFINKMTKTTTFFSGLILTISFLIGTQVQADVLTFEFANANSKTADIVGANKALTLTATEREDGVDFLLSSSWTYGENGGPGKINPQNKSPLYFYGVADIFDFGNNIGAGENGMSSDGFGSFTNLNDGVGFVTDNSFTYNEETKQNEVSISLDYLDDANWDTFMASVENNTFGFSVHLGAINQAGGSGKFITTGEMKTAPTPEPATLAVLGLGLAGLGMISRRRK